MQESPEMAARNMPVNAVYLIDSMESGGAQRQLVELVKGVDKSKINPHVVIYHDLMHFGPELYQAGLPVFCLNKTDKLGIGFFLKFRKFLFNHEIEMVHSFLNIPNFYARIAKLFNSSILVVTSERNVSINQSRVHTLLERVAWRLSDAIIVNADTIRRILVEEVGVAKNRISVVNNGINLRSFSCADDQVVRSIRQQVTQGDDVMLIGLVGRICEQKGQCYAVEAAKLLRDKRPDLNFRICFWGSENDANYVRKLRQEIANYGLSRQVILAGVQVDMPAVMKASDLLILPSLWEGFPNVLLEAMATRTPVIATDIVDNSQIIDDGRTGFLIVPGNPEALAEKIFEFSKLSSSTVEKMTDLAYQTVARRYSVESMVNNTVKVYEDLGILPKKQPVLTGHECTGGDDDLY